MREKASRISPVGRAVTAPTPDQDDPAGGGFVDEQGPAFTLPGRPIWVGCCSPWSAPIPPAGGTACTAGAADPRPAMACVASARAPVRASSIIPSNRPRIETPRRSASASTQARRSWSSRMPTTVDLEVAMTSLTVMRGVYSSGAERWQAGGGSGCGIASRGAHAPRSMDRGPIEVSRFGARQTSRCTSVLAGRSPGAGRRRERIEYTDPRRRRLGIVGRAPRARDFTVKVTRGPRGATPIGDAVDGS